MTSQATPSSLLNEVLVSQFLDPDHRSTSFGCCTFPAAACSDHYYHSPVSYIIEYLFHPYTHEITKNNIEIRILDSSLWPFGE